MQIIKIDQPITLQAIEDGFVVQFNYANRDYYLRPPDTAELDDANTTMRLSRAKFVNDYSDWLLEIPPSESDIAAIENAIKHAEKRFEEADEGTVAKLRSSYQVSTLQRSLEGRTRLEEEADDVALLARDRELALVMLCDETGSKLVDLSDDDAVRRWHNLSVRVKNRARPSIWRILEALDSVPFVSDPTPDENID